MTDSGCDVRVRHDHTLSSFSQLTWDSCEHTHGLRELWSEQFLGLQKESDSK